jgi:D-alanyl-D-alanine carboxypeptidase (penicillin-binding protein 5/6)
MYEAGVALKNVELWYGDQESVDVGVGEPVVLTIPRGHYEELETALLIPAQVDAPIAAGQKIGELVITLRGQAMHTADLVALDDAPEGGFFSRLGDSIYLFFARLFS